MCVVSINGPGDLDLWPFVPETETSPPLMHDRPLDSRIIPYVHDGRTDGRTKATLIAPFPTGGGIKLKTN